jgi:fumarate reductase subunit D
LIPLTILCAAIYLPFGLVVGIGSTVYAHMQRRTVVRNILLVLLIVPILILRILQP